MMRKLKMKRCRHLLWTLLMILLGKIKMQEENSLTSLMKGCIIVIFFVFEDYLFIYLLVYDNTREVCYEYI